MATRIFIDGYNLLWASDTHRPEAIRNFEGSRDQLINRLASSPRLLPHQVTVVFDAYKTDAYDMSAETISGIDVIFTRQGQSADSVLKDLAREHGSAAVVISSDREVARYAEKRGCGVLGSHEFDLLLDRPSARDQDDDTDEDDEITSSKKGPSRRDPKARRRALSRLR